MFVAVLLLVGLLGADQVLRRIGLFGLTDEAWPALYRPLSAPRGAPYRAPLSATARLVAPTGMPRSASLLVFPVALQSLLWTTCVGLAALDFSQVLRGTRAASPAVVSLLWCVARSCAGWVSLEAAFGQRRRRFALASLAVLALDATLFVLPVPCSDVRSDDVQVAAAGVLFQGLFLLGFAWALWQRRGGRPQAALDSPQP